MHGEGLIPQLILLEISLKLPHGERQLVWVSESVSSQPLNSIGVILNGGENLEIN